MEGAANTIEQRLEPVSVLDGLRVPKEHSRMQLLKRASHRSYWILGPALLLLPGWFAYAGQRSDEGKIQDALAAKARPKKPPSGDALRLNSLGVAYLNQ